MKHLLVLVCVTALLGFTGVTHAKKPKADGSKGTQGTVATLSGNTFTMTDKDEKTIKVVCDNNTKFMQDGQQVKPDAIKVGAKVSVVGGNDGTQITAQTVTVMASTDGKKKKS